MAQKGSQGPEKAWLLNEGPIEFAETAKKRLEEFGKAQTELFEQFQQGNKRWLDRMQAEVNLASEFASKLSSARSIPDAMTACQEWGSRRFEMIAEDAKHVLDNTQKVMQAGTHIFTNGFASKNPGIST